MNEALAPVYPLMVTTNNNNKFYKMIPKGDKFKVEYGRVGSSCQYAEYPLNQWKKKYNEKIKKGYVDQTHLIQDLIVAENPNKITYKEIEDEKIAEIVHRLMDMAAKKVAQNYKVGSNQVTQAMVDEAQKKIDSLMLCNDVDYFNKLLLELFTIIPRRMGYVNDYLASSDNDFARIIKDEQDLLDVMRGQVVTNIAQNESKSEECSNKTILEAMGITIEPVNDREISMIKSKLGDVRSQFRQAWKIENSATQKRFDEFAEKENITVHKLFWHGSRNENWWSIINNGLMIRPANAVYTGSMFGDAIYASPTARKSVGYTSLSGSYWTKGDQPFAFLALMDFQYGKPYDIYTFDSKYYKYNYKKLQSDCPGANCLHAHAGTMLRNDEIVFYNVEQCTIKYLVEIR